MCAPYVEARPKGGARAEKEIGEKAQKIIRYQIVSTYFLHGAFKVLFSAWRPVFSRLLVWQCVHPCYPWTPWRPVYIIRYAGTKKKVANLRSVLSIYYKEILENLAFNTSEIDEHKKIIDEQENMNLLKTLFSRQHKRKSDSVNLKMWCTTETTK